MEENSLNLEQIKETIKNLKLEILEKENLIDELLKIINKKSEDIEEFIEEN